ncbi:MAG TPA: hypothetical protein VE080_00805 [Candidatus Aquicultoraceae bacterium]|nr:hypothetical protein [Candidatus Aquicultoraceae bacterium]
MVREIVERILAAVNFLKMKDEGQGLAEYALILVLIAIVCVAALVFLGGSISGVLSCIGSNIASQPGGGT